ncbi:MAG: hypothetical protein IPM74_08425 [Crocinitomicaceae bacterium]|nr:hypothetical protein [Crocinitomicaceae bacterium]
MKALYVIALILCVVFGIVVLYLASEYDRVSWSIFMDSLYGDGYYDYYDYRRSELSQITMIGGVVSLLFTAFFALTYSFTIAKINRTTAKVMSIIGVCFTGIVFLASFVPVIEPGGISFDEEFGPFLFLYMLIMLAFSIVNLVQAVRNGSKHQVSNYTVDDIA